MDRRRMVRIAIFCAALFVIADGIWVAYAPGTEDKRLSFALVVIGIFMVLTGYSIALENPP